MYLDLDRVSQARTAAPLWTVLLPFFNERDYLAATIASLAAQTVTFRLILIDNASTDGSAEIAVAAARAHGIDHLLVVERTPGKVAALQAGFVHAHTRWTATCDADTLYPAGYLAQAGALLSRKGCVVAGAYFIEPGTDEDTRRARARTVTLIGRLLPRQSHTGGAGQAFCTRTLRQGGGFDPARWNLVLEDHEIIHRALGKGGRCGTMRYSRDFWCAPSPRERDRASIRWTGLERLMYSLAAPFAGDWFFYEFLGPRLMRRRLASHRIRERQFQFDEGPVFASPHPVL
ncbi:glycosyltransferase family 2 protein [Sphingomonas floccifaciens]|uniref:Glycosyltransferase family 2 protein n=1 Tax=Sphingomonas floccifaciens TaxID=1844115 RepID=A0ABW4NE39_9SPHN